MPDGFATLLLAGATILAGSFVIIGARVAWHSVQRQIKSAEDIDEARHEREIATFEAGFIAELLVYSRGIADATSTWNERAIKAPGEPVIQHWPVFVEPLYFMANVANLGLVRHQWMGGAIIGFYSNLRELNEQAREMFAGRPTVNVTSGSIAERLRLMAANLSQALDGLNDDRKFPIPQELGAERLFMPDGNPIGESKASPKDLQALLMRLAGVTSSAPDNII